MISTDIGLAEEEGEDHMPLHTPPPYSRILHFKAVVLSERSQSLGPLHVCTPFTAGIEGATREDIPADVFWQLVAFPGMPEVRFFKFHKR